MLSMLLEGTTARQCYERGKALGLKKLSADEARDRSLKLISEQTKLLTDKKVTIALQKFIVSKMENGFPNFTKSQVSQYLAYLKSISSDYKEFRAMQDDMVLFGGELELNDIRRAVTKDKTTVGAGQLQSPFVIVPISAEEFRRLSDPYFL